MHERREKIYATSSRTRGWPLSIRTGRKPLPNIGLLNRPLDLDLQTHFVLATHISLNTEDCLQCLAIRSIIHHTPCSSTPCDRVHPPSNPPDNTANMSERKVLQKYYPPDWDPGKIERRRGPKQTGPKVQTVRLMAPFSMKCTSCGEFIYKGRKFNARKETTDEKSTPSPSTASTSGVRDAVPR